MLLKNSVGIKGINQIADVKLIQEVLNRTVRVPYPLLRVDGIAGFRTQIAITNFQKKIVELKHPDGLIEPNGKTWNALKRYLAESPSIQSSHHRLFESAKIPAFHSPLFISASASVVSSKKIAWGGKVSKAFKLRVIEVCNDLGFSPDYLMSCMAFETGETFSASIKNAAGSGAVGLIQFMPPTAVGLGTTIEALAAMTAVEQLTYVKKYFSRYKNKLHTLEDVYMVILYPAAIGEPVSHVLFDQGTKTYTQNSGLDIDGDGKITVMEVASIVRQKYEKGLKAGYLG